MTFRQRVETLERLETFPDAALAAQLESENLQLFETLRNQIKQGTRPQILRAPDSPSGQSYDYLDELILGILQYEDPSDALNLDPEIVPYQPTPARHILDLLARTQLTSADVLIDLGSGLGQVALLTSICTEAQAIGIELDPAYVHCATQAARSLNLTRVNFLQQDARQSNLSRGTVFYLYTPFRGEILRTVLDKLRQESKTRNIQICTFGPCTPIIAREPWLEPTAPTDEDHIAIFHPSR
jgi:hypothetical protein